MRNDGSRMIANQTGSCAATISDVDMDPAYRKTATKDRPIAISYEIICALERRPPSSG